MEDKQSLIAEKLGICPASSKISMYFKMPDLSTTKADRLETPFIPKAKVSARAPYEIVASLLKSLSKSKFNFCSSLNLASENKESTEMPITTAFKSL